MVLWPLPCEFCRVWASASKVNNEISVKFAWVFQYMWRNTPKSGGMRWEGSARNPTSRLTLPFLEQCYHFEILTSINTLTCFISSSLVKLVKKLFVYFAWFIRAYRFGTVKKSGTSQFAHLGFDNAWGFSLILPLFIRPLLAYFSFDLSTNWVPSQIFSKIDGYMAEI